MKLLSTSVGTCLAGTVLVMLAAVGCGADGTPEPASIADRTLLATEPTADLEETGSELIESANWPFPQERQFGLHRAIIHAPQIQTWPEFKTFTALLAIEFFPADASQPLMAMAQLRGDTRLQFDERLVIATNSVVGEVFFAGGAVPDVYDLALR